MPADSPGGYDSRWRQDHSPWHFLFGDGEWHWVQARAWWNDRHGRRIVQIEWYADGATWGEAYVAEADKMRRFEG